MSNGATDVLWDVLRLAADALGRPLTPDDPLGWMLLRKQDVSHYGWVGFDLDQMPWLPSPFVQQKAGFLTVIDVAASGQVWSQLDYTPNPEITGGHLRTLRAMIAGYEVFDLDILP